jgi:hypothetical protein
MAPVLAILGPKGEMELAMVAVIAKPDFEMQNFK